MQNLHLNNLSVIKPKLPPMNKITTARVVCAVASLTTACGLTAGAQTLDLQLKAVNYNDITGVWTDTSGNGDTATYSGSSTPTLVAGATPNGSSAVNLTGAGSLLLNTSLAAGSGYTIFAYIMPATDGGTRNALTGGSSSTALEYDVYNGHADFLTEYTADVAHGNATLPTTSFSLIDLAVNSSGSSFNLNGASDGTGAGATFGNPITRIGNNEGGGDGYVGDIAEIDIYSGVLSAGQISAVESQFTAEYVTSVPEPSTWAMLAGGLGMLPLVRRFRGQ
jgi:hypothetical protein